MPFFTKTLTMDIATPAASTQNEKVGRKVADQIVTDLVASVNSDALPLVSLLNWVYVSIEPILIEKEATLILAYRFVYTLHLEAPATDYGLNALLGQFSIPERRAPNARYDLVAVDIA